jgi:hypothetical protein
MLVQVEFSLRALMQKSQRKNLSTLVVVLSV